MTNEAQAGDEDFVASIFGGAGYTPAEPAIRAFQPWHRPRKQFVRREQWAELLKRLYRDRPAGEPLRYLGLPGTDLIDLRYLYDEVCRAAGRPMRFLGFNTEAQPGSSAHIELSLSLDEVRRLPNVDPLSNVIQDDFRRLADEASIAWSRARSLGPFDVVNIDLCDGLATEPPQNEGSLYQALARLIALQVRNANPWLLLVTTRIGRGLFDEAAEQRLVDLFRANVDRCEGFVRACADLIEADASSIDLAACSEQDYLCVMIVALAKWLAAHAQAHGPNRVELASTQAYRVNSNATCEDLVSLALRFEPVIATPPDALAPTPPEVIDECYIAERIARRARARKNIDDILAGDPGLDEERAVETEVLLLEARYDVKPYRSWLAG